MVALFDDKWVCIMKMKNVLIHLSISQSRGNCSVSGLSVQDAISKLTVGEVIIIKLSGLSSVLIVEIFRSLTFLRLFASN